MRRGEWVICRSIGMGSSLGVQYWDERRALWGPMRYATRYTTKPIVCFDSMGGKCWAHGAKSL